jgi:hypothetical protein
MHGLSLGSCVLEDVSTFIPEGYPYAGTNEGFLSTRPDLKVAVDDT